MISENHSLTSENWTRSLTRSSLLRTFLVYIFTDWPWATAKYINCVEQRHIRRRVTCSKFCDKLLHFVITFVFIISRLLPIGIGYVAQLMTCFRRDYPNFTWEHTEITNATNHTILQYCRLKCDVNKEFVTGLLIPDAILVSLAIWVYCGLKLGYSFWQRLGCKGLKAVLKADTSKSLNKLVKEIKSELPRKSLIKVYTVVPVGYIVLSQLLSIYYLFAFGVTRKDVVIQSPLASSIYETQNQQRDLKVIIIIFSFVGFIAFDLLYVRVIMRYAYRSQLFIYYLQSIKRQINQDQENQETLISQENINKIYKFVKHLNASSATTGFVILITGFAATSCVINLLNTTSCPIHPLDKGGNTHFNSMQLMQDIAVALRLILWTFLMLFPFHKAAEVNTVLRKLSLFMCTPPHHVCGNHYQRLHYITLKARLIGIPVHPWLPYMVVFLLLLTIMIGSNISLYEHLL